MGMHDGHRQRLKERFRLEGLDSFNEVNALELLLFYCIPRQDVNPLAHALLDYFGSYTKVMEASPEELKNVPGIGDEAATFLSLVTAAGRYYQEKNLQPGAIMRTTEECAEYMMPYFFGRGNEVIYMLCLDAKCKVIGCPMLGEGSATVANVPIPKAVSVAVTLRASSVILAHNHPSGIAAPSPDDEMYTIELAKAMKAVGIKLSDHIVIADGDYVSMAQSRQLRQFFV